MLKPAYHIPLPEDQLKLMGEIAAIQGFFEWQMHLAISELAKLSLPATMQKLKKKSLEQKADKLRLLVWEKYAEQCQLTELADLAASAISEYAPLRNALFHSAFVLVLQENDEDYGYSFSTGASLPNVPIGIIRTNKMRRFPLLSISYTRELCAYISVLIAQIASDATPYAHGFKRIRTPARPKSPEGMDQVLTA